ncbi:hypothetical protein FF096_15645 [Micromonospora sp. CP22]|nr:hypothetical protein [Micromonospora sp. CP22]
MPPPPLAKTHPASTATSPAPRCPRSATTASRHQPSSPHRILGSPLPSTASIRPQPRIDACDLSVHAARSLRRKTGGGSRWTLLGSSRPCEIEEVVPVNVSTWVLPSGVTVGR